MSDLMFQRLVNHFFPKNKQIECDTAWVENTNGDKFYPEIIAYTGGTKELVINAMVLRFMTYLTQQANYWGCAPLDFEQHMDRVSFDFGFPNCTFVWRTKPEIEKYRDGWRGYMRFTILRGTYKLFEGENS